MRPMTVNCEGRDTEGFQICPHALQRATERGFDPAIVHFVLACANVRRDARENRKALFLSPARVKQLARWGMRAHQLEQLRALCVIAAGDTAVTVHDGADLRRRYS